MVVEINKDRDIIRVVKVRLVVDVRKLIRKAEEKKAAKLPKHEPGEQPKN